MPADFAVDCLDCRRLEPCDAQQLGDLFFAVWPPKDKPDARPAPVGNSAYAGPEHRRPRSFVVRIDGRIVATAGVDARELDIGGRRLVAAALGGVCTYPEHRLHGYAAAAVRAVFALVDAGDFDLSLFQTPVPRFYEKLGCRLIANRLVNSRGADPAANPFWDPYAMVYPATLDLGTAVIDTLGPGW
jgi:GNAT superfamily N-acetyltransferase